MIIEIAKDFAAKYWSNQVFSMQSLLGGLFSRCVFNRIMLHSQKALVKVMLAVLIDSTDEVLL